MCNHKSEYCIIMVSINISFLSFHAGDATICQFEKGIGFPKCGHQRHLCLGIDSN